LHGFELLEGSYQFKYAQYENGWHRYLLVQMVKDAGIPNNKQN
jgi:hypothetical protein